MPMLRLAMFALSAALSIASGGAAARPLKLD